jgi:signal transduction histidine kinase
MKFTPKGGRVEARIGFEASDDATQATGSKSAGYVEFAVEDTGVGIAAEDLERIFEPYTKGAYREGGSHTGAGLGLAVIRQIADVMQGTVWAEQREGGGSRFTFRFPAPVLDEEDYE